MIKHKATCCYYEKGNCLFFGHEKRCEDFQPNPKRICMVIKKCPNCYSLRTKYLRTETPYFDIIYDVFICKDCKKEFTKN